MAWRTVRCSSHGASPWCYVQHDGRHIDATRCHCGERPSATCPVDAHREAAWLWEIAVDLGAVPEPAPRPGEPVGAGAAR